MITTKARADLQSKDLVGMGETYEARMRGALSPYNMIISLLEELKKDPTDELALKYLVKGVDNHKHQLAKIMELLLASEQDREELEMLVLTDTLKDYEVSEREHPNESRRTKINFHTVNGENYEIIPPKEIAESSARIAKAKKKFKKNNPLNKSE